MAILLLVLLLAYLLGSIPFGLLLTRMAGLGDVRNIGSGNIGATNVLRTGNKKLAAATLLLDGLKGALAIYFANYLFHYGQFSINTMLTGTEDGLPMQSLQIDAYMSRSMAAIFSVIGHIFPVWLGFKGGKGVATIIGVLLAYYYPIGLCFIAIWGILFYMFRISSLAALAASVLTTVLFSLYSPFHVVFIMDITHGQTHVDSLKFLPYLQPIGILLPFTLLLFYTHRANIRRLLSGTEPQFGKPKP